MLKHGLDREPLEEAASPSPSTSRVHENVRGADYYH
jgi:hypothetical protein